MRPAPAEAGTSERLGRIAAGLGAFAFLPAGLWAMVDPSSFFE